ncbi:hypothetical protein [Aeromicrobium sp. UC242_57]|uniref:hypothetical protein n=1 Tax=Aeromicrobium sp. UC242_57 TaxID=3374624 RepID=UPI0037876BD4
MPSHRSPGRARVPRSFWVYVGLLSLAVAVLLAAALAGWLPPWFDYVVYALIAVSFIFRLREVPAELRRMRDANSRIDPEYRRSKRR